MLGIDVEYTKSDIKLHCPFCKSDDTVKKLVNKDIIDYKCGHCGRFITQAHAIYKLKHYFEYKLIESDLSEEILNQEGLEEWEFYCSNNHKLIFRRKKQVEVRVTPEWETADHKGEKDGK
jgi:uncharacterized Zn finger protein